MGRCKECRWWQKNPHVDCGTCERVTSADPRTMAIVEVEDPYVVAWLTTEPDFGCVQWEAVP